MGSKSALHWGVSVKVYFDLCVYNRPFDDQMQPRIMIESVGVVTIMALVGTKQIHSINSFVLDYENRKNPSLGRRSFIEKLLADHWNSLAQMIILEKEPWSWRRRASWVWTPSMLPQRNKPGLITL